MCDLQARDILSCLAGFDDGTVQAYYCIEYDNKVWLVTAWWINRETDIASPERMIRVDSLELRIQKLPPGSPFQYANILLPKVLIDDVDPRIPRFEVRNLPTRPTVHRRDLKPLPPLFA